MPQWCVALFDFIISSSIHLIMPVLCVLCVNSVFFLRFCNLGICARALPRVLDNSGPPSQGSLVDCLYRAHMQVHWFIKLIVHGLQDSSLLLHGPTSGGPTAMRVPLLVVPLFMGFTSGDPFYSGDHSTIDPFVGRCALIE